MLETIAVIVALGLIVIAGRVLGADTDLAVAGLFPAQGRSDWPHGVQEWDVPRFVFGRPA